MMGHHFIAIVLAFFIDLVVGDPPKWPHPVKWFGKIISFFDQRYNQGNRRKLKGVLILLVIVLVVSSISFFLLCLLSLIHPVIGLFGEALLIATTIAQKGLGEAAEDIVEPLQSNRLAEARQKLAMIVGRDTENLSEREIVRATVETVAENTVDGITAPLFWALVGGAPLALVYRAVNTCDSMVGYKNEKYALFGWASARLDDLLNWVPARLTGIIMIHSMTLKTTYRHVWSILLRDAKKHSSPNSGWGEAAAAAVLGIQLGGMNYYNGKKSYRMEMGDQLEHLKPVHITRMIQLMRRTSTLFLLLLLLGGVLFELANAWI